VSKSKKFVDEMYEKHPNNPLNPHEFIMKHPKGLALFHMSHAEDDTAHVHYFRTHPQRSGIGSHALKELQGHAKRHGVKLHLHSGGDGQTPQRVLDKFYKKHGFKGKNGGSMTWDPKDDINEDAPTVNAGGGAIAGIGIGPQGEPGRKAVMMPLARRRLDVLNKVMKKDKWPTITESTKQIREIPLSEIHREGGHKVEEYEHTSKVKDIRNKIRKKKRLPPVEVTRMTDSIRKTEKITDPTKKWFLIDGNHRYAAHHFEGHTHIKATNYYHHEDITKD
jgi:hypothetical protein